jgi:hypothetical protein
MNYIKIIADTNDGDCITEFRKITDEELELIKPMVRAIANFKPYKVKTADGRMDWTHHHNYPTDPRYNLGEKSAYEFYAESGLVPKESFYLFDDMVPRSEYQPHTIESIEILDVNSIKTLL